MDMRNFLSEFINKEDIKDNKTWKIEDVNITLIEDKEKLQLNMVANGLHKTLTLNQTNLKILINLFGKESDKLKGKSINLITTKVNYKGDIIDSVTIDEDNTPSK